MLNRFRLFLLWMVAFGIAIGWAQSGYAQRSGRGELQHLRDSQAVRAAFRDLAAPISESVVEVLSGGKMVALGTIVGADGWILTKASELSGKLSCRFKDASELPASIIGVHADHDLALLKVEAANLPAVTWKSDADYRLGQWVFTPGVGEEPIAIGVVSVAPRNVPRDRGILGINLEESPDGPRVTQVLPRSAASKAGIQVDDIITHVNGERVTTRATLVDTIRRMWVGDDVTLRIRRGEKEQELTATLGSANSERLEFQNHLGGPLSNRSSGFPAALQHDSPLRPDQCGSPLVDLSGHVVGINIARAGRVHSYAIPASIAQQVLPELQSGKLAPGMGSVGAAR
jgi:serine protease Do